MKQRRMDVKRIAKSLAEQTDAMPGVPLIEIGSDRRVLIENHKGILEYGTQRIVVKAKFGVYCVHGCGLTIAKMSKEQLVIFGRIDGVALERRC